MTKNLNGKVALVTGGNSGIGRATVVAFANAGAKVVIAARRVPESEATVSEIRENGGEGIFVPTDVSISEDVQALISKTLDTYGRVDYAVNNAGVEDMLLPTHLCTEENWDRVINTNLKGVFLCMKYEITQMLQQGGGSIVNITSVAGMRGFPGFPAYSASKGGLIQLSRTAALEYADANVYINVVCPGGVDTPLVERVFARAEELNMEHVNPHPLQKVAQPEEVAEHILFVAANAAPHMVGHNFIIDDGWSIQ
jgi:NAD(P)-dependent dehydrogenase (short-subunit alcohol dehydrogenase family)